MLGRKTFVVLMIAALMVGCGQGDDNHPMVERSLKAEDVWDGRGGVEDVICLSGVEYLYVNKTFVGGLTPNYVHGKVQSCGDTSFPEGFRNYSFYQVCRNDTLYYQFSNMKGAAVSIALSPDGAPRSCDDQVQAEPPAQQPADSPYLPENKAVADFGVQVALQALSYAKSVTREDGKTRVSVVVADKLCHVTVDESTGKAERFECEAGRYLSGERRKQ